MQFTKLCSLIAVTVAAVNAKSHGKSHVKPHANKHDAATRNQETITVNANADVAVNVTGITESFVTLLTGLGELGDDGSNIVGNLLKGLLLGGSGALNQTASGIANVLGESPAIAEALHNILGTIEICAS